MVHINIKFDRANRRYSAGDAINLSIRVQNSSSQKYRSIYVRVKGFAHVEWTESKTVTRNKKQQTIHTTYTANQIIFMGYETLEGDRSGMVSS